MTHIFLHSLRYVFDWRAQTGEHCSRHSDVDFNCIRMLSCSQNFQIIQSCMWVFDMHTQSRVPIVAVFDVLEWLIGMSLLCSIYYRTWIVGIDLVWCVFEHVAWFDVHILISNTFIRVIIALLNVTITDAFGVCVFVCLFVCCVWGALPMVIVFYAQHHSATQTLDDLFDGR